MNSTFDINDIPAMVPPPGVQPNFDNPETLHDPMLSTAIITTILLVTVVGVRIFTKAYIMRDMKLEDCKICPGKKTGCIS